MTEEKTPTFDIPKECKAGVVVNEGPDFRVEVQMVPVPEISTFSFPSATFVSCPNHLSWIYASFSFSIINAA
jgi:hypothetical protein